MTVQEKLDNYISKMSDAQKAKLLNHIEVGLSMGGYTLESLDESLKRIINDYDDVFRGLPTC